MELKNRKNVLCLIVVGLLDLRARGQSDVTSAERREVFSDLRLSCFLQSGEEERQCGVMRGFEFRLSLSLSLSLSLGVSSLLLLSAFFGSGSAVEKLVFYSFFLF